MDPKELRGLYEAYKQVNAPQEVDEAVKGESSERRKDLAAERRAGHRPLPAKEGEKYASHKLSQMAYAKRKRMGEEVEAVDEATAMAKRGYDETKLRKRAGGGEAADRATSLENRPTYGDKNKEAQRSRYARAQRGDFRKTASSNPGLHGYGHKSDDPAVKAKQAARGAQRGALTPNEKKELNREEFQLDQMIESLVQKGHTEQEAYALVAQFTLDEISDKRVQKVVNARNRRFDRSVDSGAPNKEFYQARRSNKLAARRNARTGSNVKVDPDFAREEFELWVNALIEEGYDLSDYTWDEMYEFYLDEDSRRMSNKQKTASVRQNIKAFGSNFTPPNNYDPDANRGKGEVLTRKQIEKKRRKSLRQEDVEFVDESQEARNNPEKYEREQSKKTAPVRGERTPMPPRGDKRREDFEKWYAKQMGR